MTVSPPVEGSEGALAAGRTSGNRTGSGQSPKSAGGRRDQDQEPGGVHQKVQTGSTGTGWMDGPAGGLID